MKIRNVIIGLFSFTTTHNHGSKTLHADYQTKIKNKVDLAKSCVHHWQIQRTNGSIAIINDEIVEHWELVDEQICYYKLFIQPQVDAAYASSGFQVLNQCPRGSSLKTPIDFNKVQSAAIQKLDLVHNQKTMTQFQFVSENSLTKVIWDKQLNLPIEITYTDSQKMSSIKMTSHSYSDTISSAVSDSDQYVLMDNVFFGDNKSDSFITQFINMSTQHHNGL